MTFADQDENDIEELQGETTETGSAVDDESSDSDSSDSDSSDSDKAEEQPESCGDGCGCSDSGGPVVDTVAGCGC